MDLVAYVGESFAAAGQHARSRLLMRKRRKNRVGDKLASMDDRMDVQKRLEKAGVSDAR